MTRFWGADPAAGADSMATAPLAAMRARGIGIPVIVFAERHVFQRNKRRALELGALGIYCRWESLLRAIQLALDPESETG